MIQLTNVTSRLVTSGNLSFAPGSSLGIQISPTSAGMLTVGGSTTLAGNGTLIVTPADRPLRPRPPSGSSRPRAG